MVYAFLLIFLFYESPYFFKVFIFAKSMMKEKLKLDDRLLFKKEIIELLPSLSVIWYNLNFSLF